MKRSGFKPKGWEPKPVTTVSEVFTVRPKPVALRRDDGKARAVVAVPKGEKAKPGKRTPTAAEREWMDAIVSYGCIACRRDGNGVVPPAVHHILSGGRRMGHLYTLPLCDPGHHQNGQDRGMVSRHPWKARFEQKYGSELALLRELRTEIDNAAA